MPPRWALPPLHPAGIQQSTACLTGTATLGQKIDIIAEAKKEGAHWVTPVGQEASPLQGTEGAVKAAADTNSQHYGEPRKAAPD